MESDIPIRTIDFELNSCLRETLNKYKKIESPALCLFPDSNIYSRPPRLVFRFKEGTSEDYELLTKAINEFEGKLDWIIYRAKESKKGNHIIEPQISFEHRNSNESDEIKVWALSDLIRTCDLAVADINPLTEQIAKYLRPNGD